MKSQTVLSHAHGKGKRQTKPGYLIPRQKQTPFYCQCGQTWEPIAQKGCRGLHPWRYTKPDQTQP